MARPIPETSADRRAAGFVSAYSLAFAFETILDPLATGPLVKALGLGDTAVATGIMLAFVLLGDFRVFALIFATAAAGRPLGTPLRRAARFTLVVPIFSGLVYALLTALWPELEDQWRWVIYEFGFVAMAVYLARVWIPKNVASSDVATGAFLREMVSYAALYYAVWAISDLLILVGGRDEGWALHALANQLYYSFWIPFVYFRFFVRR